MSKDHRKFTGVSPEQFEFLISELRRRGIAPAGDPLRGIVTYRGVAAEYHYRRGTRTLDISIVKKPALMPLSVIWQLLERAAEKYLATRDKALRQRRDR